LPEYRFFGEEPGVPLRELVPKLNDEGLDLLQQMLQMDPTKRLSARDGLNHPFLADVRERNNNN
jgi:serine/threonine protein kinase